jgi:hypothetical protein
MEFIYEALNLNVVSTKSTSIQPTVAITPEGGLPAAPLSRILHDAAGGISLWFGAVAALSRRMRLPW